MKNKKIECIVSVLVTELFIILLFSLLFFAMYTLYSSDISFGIFIAPFIVLMLIALMSVPTIIFPNLKKYANKYYPIVAVSLITLMIIQEMFFVFFGN